MHLAATQNSLLTYTPDAWRVVVQSRRKRSHNYLAFTTDSSQLRHLARCAAANSCSRCAYFVLPGRDTQDYKHDRVRRGEESNRRRKEPVIVLKAQADVSHLQSLPPCPSL